MEKPSKVNNGTVCVKIVGYEGGHGNDNPYE